MSIREFRAVYTTGLLLVALALSVAGCRKSSPGSASPGDSAANEERLRSLPYVGFSSEKVGDKSGVVHYEKQRAWPGYNLYTSLNLCRADLVDMEGKAIKSWSNPDCEQWSTAQLLPNGDVVVAGMRAIHNKSSEEYQKAAYLLRMTWDGERVWQVPVSAHHNFNVTPEGNLAVLTAGWRLIPEYDANHEVREHGIAIVSPEGKVLQTASLYDLLTSNPGEFTLQKVGKTGGDGVFGKDDIDLFHSNMIEFMHWPGLVSRSPIYSLENALVTVRHQNTMAIIDWPRKKLIWAWGQGVLSGPHYGHVLENGNILVFDNGLKRGWSRVIELDPLAKKIVWEYKAPNPKDFFTVSGGGAERLPNGDTLITNTREGQVFEVTPNGEMVWEFFNPRGDKEGHRATVSGMRRYDASFVEGLIARNGGKPEPPAKSVSTPAASAPQGKGR